MRYTKKLVDEVNPIRRLFGKPELDASNLTKGDAAELLEQIEAKLSPENLTMDGELSRGKVAQRRKMLEGARGELENIAA
jgi:hypothetical protein